MELRRLCRPVLRSCWGWISCDIRSLQRPLSTSFGTSTPLAGAVDSLPIPNCTPVLPRQRGVFVEDKRNSFEESQEPQQFLSRDGQTIVCVHPTRPTSLLESKPLRSRVKQVNKDRRTSLEPEEEVVARRLRAMDGALWSVNTLARHFNVSCKLIRLKKKGIGNDQAPPCVNGLYFNCFLLSYPLSITQKLGGTLENQVAPASLQRQRQLDQEKTKMAAMRPYQKKLYKQQLQTERQKKLEGLISKNKEILSSD